MRNIMNNITKIEEQKTSLSLFKEMAQIALKSGKYPKEYDEATILNVFLTAKDLGISPMKALNGGFYIVNGKISMATNLMVDRIRTGGHSIKIIDWSRDKCVIIGKRKDNEDSAKIEFNMEDAQLAGLLGSPVWKKYPKTMLYNRAMSMLARVLFPDVVGNAYSEEEKQEIQGVPLEKRTASDIDETITVDIMTGEVKPASLSEEQCAILDVYFSEDMKAIEKIKDRYQLEDVYKLDPNDFNHVIEILKARKERSLHGQTAMA